MSQTPSQAGRRGASPAKTNGAPRASYAGGTVHERHGDQPGASQASRLRAKRNGLKLAPFAAVEVQATGAPMWPVHPVAWFHPELKPGLPDSSGLTIESYRKLPAPDFLRLEVTPAAQSHSSDEVCDPLVPDVKHQIPRSALAPSGWDARVVLLSVAGSAPKESAVAGEALVAPHYPK